MGEPSLGTPPSERPLEDRLDSWKEIAAYLKRDVTTVQRWEKREGMPVYRHLHDRMGSVYASRTELEEWMSGRKLRSANDPGSNGTATSSASKPSWRSIATALPRSTFWWLLAVGALLAIGAGFWFQRTEHFWRNPIATARFQTITDFDGSDQAAAISRDGHLVAFLSDRDGPMDVWVTQVGSGEFHNLTRGGAGELINPSIRSLGFSPDGSLVTFWVRRQDGNISIWAVPTLGGEPKPYLDGVAEFDWTKDGDRLAYHTPGPGDPLYVSDGSLRSGNRPIFAAPAGLHSHFPLWAPDARFIYFVQGSLPDRLDIWRIRPEGGTPERITSHFGRVSYPVLLDRRTLMYLASASDGSGPWLYTMDVERRIPHQLTSGPELYTSLSANADGRRLVATIASPTRTLWRVPMDASHKEVSEPVQVSLTTGTGFSPRLGPNFLLYVSEAGTNESLWRLSDGSSTELWRGEGAQLFGGPAISPDGRDVAFSFRQDGRTLLYVMRADGTNGRVVTDSLGAGGRAGVVRRWSIHYLVGERSWRTPPGPCLTRWPFADTACAGVLGRSGVVARRTLRYLLRTRYRHEVCREGGHSRGCAAPATGADADPGGAARGVPSGWACAAGAAGRDSA